MGNKVEGEGISGGDVASILVENVPPSEKPEPGHLLCELPWGKKNGVCHSLTPRHQGSLFTT